MATRSPSSRADTTAVPVPTSREACERSSLHGGSPELQSSLPHLAALSRQKTLLGQDKSAEQAGPRTLLPSHQWRGLPCVLPVALLNSFLTIGVFVVLILVLLAFFPTQRLSHARLLERDVKPAALFGKCHIAALLIRTFCEDGSVP